MARSLLILQHPAFGRYWLARTTSLLGDGLVLTTLVLFGADLRGGLGVGGLLFARTVPRLLGPLAGGISDSVNRRHLMLVCDIGQAIMYVAIGILLPGYWLLAVMVASSSVLATAFAPASSASVPQLVPKPGLAKANAWLGTSVNVQVAAGPLLAGLLVAFAGYRWAFLANAASFLASASLLLATPQLNVGVHGALRSVLSTSASGLRYVWEDSVLRITLATAALAWLLLSIDTVVLVLLTGHVLHAGILGYSAAATAFGLGMIAASLVLLRLTLPGPPLIAFLLALTGGGIAMGVTGFAPLLGFVVASQFVGGVSNGVENIACDTFVQGHVDPAVLGRVFGVVTTISFGALALGPLLGGSLGDALGPRLAFILCGTATIVVVAFGGLTLLSLRIRRRPRCG